MVGGRSHGSALANALRRRAEIQKELEEIDLFVKLHERFAGTNPEHVSQIVQESDGIGTRVRGRPADFADYMETVLRGADMPLSRAALVTEVEKRGIEIPSTDKQRYLGTILWRHRDRFVNIEGKGYWLRNGLPSVTGLVQDTLYSDAPEEHSDELPEPPKAPTVYRR